MKKSLISILAGFSALLIIFIVLNSYFNTKLAREQRLLVNLDNYSSLVLEQQAWFQELSNSPEIYDSIAQNQFVFTTRIKQHFNNLSVLLQKTFPQKKQQKLLQTLTILQQNSQTTAVEAIQKMALIGFKESGYIGKMRSSIHLLETKSPNFREQILSLRRHEKDYIMRQDENYANELYAEVNLWKNRGTFPKELLIYVENFDLLRMNLSELKGHSSTTLLHIWRKNQEKWLQNIREIRGQAINQSYAISSRSSRIQLIVALVGFFILVSGSLFIIRKITRQVSYLQETMSDFIAANYQDIELKTKRIPKNEIGQLTMHFIKMARKIEWDVHVLEDRVKRRTTTLNHQKELLEIKHEEITDSLHYARQIQYSLLVSQKQLQPYFSDIHIHYQPKDLVGGDFYWMKSFREHGHDKLLFALADSTGHGVPGALLSVLGMNILDELFSKGIRMPHQLLKEMRNSILDRFLMDGEKRMDGMDVALFCLDLKTNDLLFAGAQMPLWILREEGIIELSGDRVPVGYTYTNHEEFDLHHVELKPDDRLLLFTDGLVDQFGEFTNKKMGKKQLRYLLLQHAQENSETLFHILMTHYEEWKANATQTDDCTLILLKPNKVTSEIEKPIKVKATATSV